MARPQPRLESFIKAQVATVDSLLMNAYGTVYKTGAKKVSFVKLNHKLSPTEEMLSAKNVLSNLWSVLDYCCIILYCHYQQKIPSPEDALTKGIKYPCRLEHNKERELTDWVDQKVKKFISDDYKKVRGAFSSVQYLGSCKDQPDENNNDTMKAFYYLHFLRNTLTHSSVDILNCTQEQSKVAKFIEHLDPRPNVAINIEVPKHPWLIESRNDQSKYVSKSLLHILHESCKVVADIRDQMLCPIGEHKFGDYFGFDITKDKLEIKLFQYTIERYHTKFHLGCYGLEFECKKELDDIRDKLKKKIEAIEARQTHA